MDTKELKKFEDAFQNGVYAVPSDVKVKVRALYEYCKKTNVSPSELSEEQMAKFIEKQDK
ncbi:hypothetical protein [Alkalihalobacterium bogoriense]|uniref:hypothetical protein n=1 Tax=Alkalihalobacterium bogoriense TaxID=246272 RepID=UPI00047C19B2|nr:hypothetical protein [Alkalihalobacterium bogoriense]